MLELTLFMLRLFSFSTYDGITNSFSEISPIYSHELLLSGILTGLPTELLLLSTFYLIGEVTP